MRIDITALPANVRAIIYWAYAAIGVTLGSVQVGFAAADAGQPVWLVVALSVFAYLGAAFGLTAATNTVVRQRDPEPGERYVEGTELPELYVKGGELPEREATARVGFVTKASLLG